MKTRHLIGLVVSAILPLLAFAQTSLSPASSAPDAGELTKFLNDFLDGASRNDVSMHERFWADDLIYTGSAGKRRGKAEVLRDVRKESGSEPKNEKTIFTAEDVRIQQYGTTAIVAFRLVGTTTKDNKTETVQYLNTGTFLKRDGKWQAIAWQATKMASEDEPKK